VLLTVVRGSTPRDGTRALGVRDFGAHAPTPVDAEAEHGDKQ